MPSVHATPFLSIFVPNSDQRNVRDIEADYSDQLSRRILFTKQRRWSVERRAADVAPAAQPGHRDATILAKRDDLVVQSRHSIFLPFVTYAKFTLKRNFTRCFVRTGDVS